MTRVVQLIRAIESARRNVNQIALSDATVNATGPEPGLGMGYSVIANVVIFIRPTFPAEYSVNHKAPSGPMTRSKTKDDGVGTLKARRLPLVGS